MFRLKRTGVVSTFSFVGVVFAAELLARTYAPSLPVDPGMWPRIEIAQKLEQMRGLANSERDVHVVFAGSSMMAGGIDPVVFSERSGTVGYNAAFAGPSLRTITPWVLDIVEPLLDPEVVVVGIQSRELNDGGPKHKVMYDKFVHSPGYEQATSSIASRFVGTLEQLSYFLRYRRAFREPGELFAADGSEALAAAAVRHELGPLGRRNDSPGAYHATDRFIESLFDKTLAGFSVGGAELTALEELHAGLEAEGVELVLFNMPVTADYRSAHGDPEGDRSAYRAAIERFVEDAGVTLIDGERAFRGTEAFRDPMHLDVEARTQVAEALGAALGSLAKGGVYELRCREGCEVTEQ
jgi:hypothetical protein